MWIIIFINTIWTQWPMIFFTIERVIDIMEKTLLRHFLFLYPINYLQRLDNSFLEFLFKMKCLFQI